LEIEVTSVSEAPVLGLTKEAIAPGSPVVVRVHPGRSGPRARAVGLVVTTGDGTVYPLNTDARLAIRAAAAVQAPGIAGRWAPTLESFNGVMAATRSWPLTEAGRAAGAEAARRFNAVDAAVFEDPAIFAAPVSYTATWDHRPDLELSGEACDPEVARRALAE
jgi:hypothetical protein